MLEPAVIAIIIFMLALILAIIDIFFRYRKEVFYKKISITIIRLIYLTSASPAISLFVKGPENTALFFMLKGEGQAVLYALVFLFAISAVADSYQNSQKQNKSRESANNPSPLYSGEMHDYFSPVFLSGMERGQKILEPILTEKDRANNSLQRKLSIALKENKKYLARLSQAGLFIKTIGDEHERQGSSERAIEIYEHAICIFEEISDELLLNQTNEKINQVKREVKK